MPYNADGSHKKNPTKQDWQQYHLRKGPQKKKKKTSASNTGGGSIGGNAATASASA